MVNLGTAKDDEVPPDKIYDEKILSDKSLNEMSPDVIGTRIQKSTEDLTYANQTIEVEVSPVLSTMDTPKRTNIDLEREESAQNNEEKVTTSKKLELSLGEHPAALPTKNNSSPTTPLSPPLIQEGRKYRLLYGELKKRYVMQQKQVKCLQTEQEELKAMIPKYAAEKDSWQKRFETEEKEKMASKNWLQLLERSTNICKPNMVN